MKNFVLFLFIFLFLLYPSINLYANFWDSYRDYYENNNWGVLENLLDDCANHNLTTDECIFIGLNTFKMLDSNYGEDFNHIPLKYKISQKSIHKGPYFFIDFIYNNENSLSNKTLKEFLNSCWCDYKYYDAFINNDNVKKYFDNSKIKTIEFTEIIDNLVNDKVITPSVAMILINGRPLKLHPNFFEGYNLSFSQIQTNTLSIKLFNSINFCDLKLLKILKYYNYVNMEKFIENDPNYLDNFKVTIDTQSKKMTVKQITDELRKQIGNHITLDRSVRLSTFEIQINIKECKLIDAINAIINKHNLNKTRATNPFDSNERYKCQHLCIRKEDNVYVFGY